MTFSVMTNFWLHDEFLTSWRTIWLLDELFDLMMRFLLYDKFLASWQTFWRHDERCYVMYFLRSWRVFDVMTNFLNSWLVFDMTFNVMTNVFTSWRVFWHIYELVFIRNFDVMTYLWRHDELLEWRVFEVMSILLTSWRIVWRHDDPLTYFDIMTCFWHHDGFSTSWRTFWHHHARFVTCWTL